MANVTISPNMNLTIPVTGQEVGPDWANDLNNSLTVIDAHDHTTGSGVQITPQGLNINADLPLSGNNLTLVRSVRFTPQLTPLAGVSDIGCLYESGIDLYYNDGSGNQIRITQSGGIAGTPGSITGLVAPASATYVSLSQTFVWQSAALTAANMDAGAIILRNITLSSFGLTLSPPAFLAANYGITLPLLPGVKSIVSLSPAGLMAADIVADNSSIEIAGGTVLQIKDSGVTTSKIANQNVTQAKLQLRATGSTVPAGGFASATTTGFSTSSSSPTIVPGLSVTITTTGRPVFIGLENDGVSSNGLGNSNSNSLVVNSTTVRFLRDVSFISGNTWTSYIQNNVTRAVTPYGAFRVIDTPVAGTYTYSVALQTSAPSGGTSTAYMDNVKLIAYEL